MDGSDETLPLAADRDDHDDERAREGTSGRGDGGVTERLLVDDEATLMEGNAGASDAALADLGNSALMENGGLVDPAEEKLSLGETARLSLEFCMLWFLANYLASAPLAYTSVGSVTILTSTSSVWTLIFCALMRVEGFTIRKLAGVLASLAGIVLISSVDLSGKSDENRGNFPHKSQMQILIGDGMAFASAIIYGLYVTVMKLRVGNEDRVSMPLFFGLVGLFNVFFLWPGFIILHYTGIETVSIFIPRDLPRADADTSVCVATVRAAAFGKGMANRLVQLRLLPAQRHVVGLRHAPDHAAGRHRRPVHDHPALPHRRDGAVCTVL